MKISVNWLKQFTDIDLSVDELVAKIGAQLGAVEEVIDLGKKYQGIIVAKVVSCEKHPNADKLSVCWIDDGGKAEGVARNESGHIQVVCGAPNVKAGMSVAWLPPGATVPSTFDKDPLVLEARELRGVISNGMLASSQELAIGDDHSGIVEIDIDAAAGTDFADLYELNDQIIDIENKMFTHRPDCFGILGVAREIAGIQGKKFTSPDWYRAPLDRIKPGKSALPLTVKNDITELVPRFMAVVMADVTIKPSPLIIQTYLSRVGLRPINNVVDVTNYLMVLTGQPTHAYDYDKLNNASLETRKSRKGDKLKLLSGKEIKFEDDSAVLITSNDIPVGVGGVMGGADTEVGETTKNIVIECANFDMYSVRRTSMKYGLFTDAVTRFNKGQSPLQNDVVLEEAVATMQYVSGGHVASNVFDVKAAAKDQATVETNASFIGVRLGSSLPVEDIARLLENVEFGVEVHGDTLKVTPPYWRTDIELPEDIVEEVGRLHGFDDLPIELPARSIKAAETDPGFNLKRHLRHILSRAGANEALTYGFVHGNLLEKAGQDSSKAFRLSNALSPDLQYYRLSILPSLLAHVHGNTKAGFDEFALFEINKSHTKEHADDDEGVPKEFETLALVVATADKIKREGAAYYQARSYLDMLAENLGLVFRYEPFAEAPTHQAALPFEPSRSARVLLGEKILGVVGEFKPSVQRGFKLPARTAGIEISISSFAGAKSNTYRQLSRYPSVEQDISLKVPSETSHQTVQMFLQDNLGAPTNSSWQLSPLDIYSKNDAKHFTFRLRIASFEKTMTAGEVNQLLDDVATKAKTDLGAERL
jgi:phenylalanyl-tRNA synthetase beta chain